MFVAPIDNSVLDYLGKKKSSIFERVGMKVIFERDTKGFEKAEMS